MWGHILSPKQVRKCNQSCGICQSKEVKAFRYIQSVSQAGCSICWYTLSRVIRGVLRQFGKACINRKEAGGGLGIGNLSAWYGKYSPASTRKGQWGARSRTQDTCPQTGSPMGNQACIVPRLLWDLFLLKLPHPGLRQQMFTAYL